MKITDLDRDLKHTNINGDNRYNWNGEENIRLNENQDNYQVNFILIMRTNNLDEFSETYSLSITKGHNGFNGDLIKVKKSLQLITDKSKKQ